MLDAAVRALFRVVLLFFSIEKEAIQYILNYENGRSGGGEAPWMHGYSALGGAFAEMFPLPGQDKGKSGYSSLSAGQADGGGCCAAQRA